MMASTTLTPGRTESSRFSLLWLSVFALLAVVTLLFAFQHVVHAAVDRAQIDRIQQSEQATAVWQCKQRSARAERSACMAAASRGARPPAAVLTSSAQ